MPRIGALPQPPVHLKRHPVYFNKARTSVSLETEFWDEFVSIAKRKNVSINGLVGQVNQSRPGNLSSAIRVFVLNEIRATLVSQLT